MRLLRRPNAALESDKPCLVIGAGLIGMTVIRALRRHGWVDAKHIPTDWNQTELRREAFQEARVALATNPATRTIQLIWCAGSGSLSATEEHLVVEREAFEEFLAVARSLEGQFHLELHFISSAGALFEGQRRVDRDTRPAPGTPYGHMKLEQEQALDIMSKHDVVVNIYRPSSVYGSHEFHRRSGLVSHVLWNALRSRPTTLEANIHALRDYVHHADIGSYIAGMISGYIPDDYDNGPLNRGHHAPRIRFLVSAKPTSIHEMMLRIERLIGRSLVYRLNPEGKNDSDITFSERALRPGWRPVPLEVGLSAVWRETRQTFLTERTEAART